MDGQVMICRAVWNRLLKMTPLVLCLSCLGLASSGHAQSATVVPNTILFDRIESRPIFGGLGGGSGPIGGITEFYVDAYDRSKPLLSLGGEVASDYPNLLATVRLDGPEPKLCAVSTDSKVKAVCHPFAEYKQLAPLIEKFSQKNRVNFAKTVRYAMPFTVVEAGPLKPTDQSGYYDGLRVQLSNWVNSKEVVHVQFHVAGRYKAGNEPALMFKDRVYLLQSKDDPALYACPTQVFDANCQTCTDCDSKALEPYAVTPTNAMEK